jgi:hypothetical protein
MGFYHALSECRQMRLLSSADIAEVLPMQCPTYETYLLAPSIADTTYTLLNNFLPNEFSTTFRISTVTTMRAPEFAPNFPKLVPELELLGRHNDNVSEDEVIKEKKWRLDEFAGRIARLRE